MEGKKILLAIEPQLIKPITKKAGDNRRSLTKEINVAIENHVSKKKKNVRA